MGQEGGQGADDKNDGQGTEGQHKGCTRIGFPEWQFATAQIAEDQAGAGACRCFQRRDRIANGRHALRDHGQLQQDECQSYLEEGTGKRDLPGVAATPFTDQPGQKQKGKQAKGTLYLQQHGARSPDPVIGSQHRVVSLPHLPGFVQSGQISEIMKTATTVTRISRGRPIRQ